MFENPNKNLSIKMWYNSVTNPKEIFNIARKNKDIKTKIKLEFFLIAYSHIRIPENLPNSYIENIKPKKYHLFSVEVLSIK